MKDSMTIVELSQFLTLSAIKDHPWHIQGCCALTGEGLVAVLTDLQGLSQPAEHQKLLSSLSCQNLTHSIP